MKIVWTEPAVEDLAAIRDYIARDSEQYARQFIARIIEAVERLEAFPEMGRRVPEAASQGIREILFQAYRIIYRLADGGVEILSVIHGSRDLTQRSPKPWEVE